MSNPPRMVASQYFYYIKKAKNENAYAYEAKAGLTVPLFSSQELAKIFLEKARVRNHTISIISPTQMEGFSKACQNAGAKFLQLDPKPEVLKGLKARNIGEKEK